MAERAPKLRLKLEVEEVIARLEAITNSATRVPLTKRAVINPREVKELVSQLRNSLPTDMNEALQIIKYRDSIVTQAQAEAARVKSQAEKEALQKLSDSQLVKEAKARAEAILNQAREEQKALIAEAENQAASRVNGADSYAIDVLTRLEEELSTLLQTTRRGIESLKEGKVLEEPR